MKKITTKLSLVLCSIGTFYSCQKQELIIENNNTISNSRSAKAEAFDEADMVENEFLIKFKEGTSDSRKEEILNSLNGKVKEKILTKMMERLGDKEGVQLVQGNNPKNAIALANSKNWGEIEYLEPNYIYKHNAISDDPSFGSLWGMQSAISTPANQFGSAATNAWNSGNVGSSSVYVGIIDEGYMYTHPDLAANAGVNPGEIAGDLYDNDGNGLVDDVYGWDFDGNNNTVFDGVGDDHGTHVAGTIGAVGGNALGVAGVCWNVKILNAKFLGSSGGTTANAIKAVDYFTNLKVKGLNIVATNNSWGGGGFSQALLDAIVRANNAGVLFIAAAGNSSQNNDRRANYPSNYNSANVIAVASITNTGTLSSFSNYGKTQVDLGAPGSAILSTVPTASGPGYASYSGTSMATPHVTGAAALYSASHPSATAAQIKSAILSTTIPTTSLNGKTVTGGRLNVSSF